MSLFFFLMLRDREIINPRRRLIGSTTPIV